MNFEKFLDFFSINISYNESNNKIVNNISKINNVIKNTKKKL